MSILSLLALLATACCAQAASDDALRIDGHIDAAMASRIEAALGHGGRTIHVTSTGGDPLPALALARQMRRSHAALVVDGLCAGPCANYLFPAAANRMVLPGGLVIFSGAASSALAMVPAAKVNSLGDNYAPTSLQEKALLSDAGVNQALLLEAQLRLETHCYSLTSRDASGKSYVNYRSDFLGWVPSRAYLVKAGIRVDGFWPATVEQFQIAFKSAFPGGARGNVAIFGPTSPSSAASLLNQLKAVPQCDAAMPGRR
jgi:hypothetical protein